MENVDDIERMFRLMDEIMGSSSWGGYYIPRGRNIIYNNRSKDIRDSKEVEFFEDEDFIYLTMELRGVEEENLVVEPKEESIRIEVIAGEKPLKREYDLPSKILPKKSIIKFNNYVLDVRLTKKKEKKNGKK